MKKIVVTGPECTGKSSLTKALAHHFDCPYREEYARDYITQLSAPYSQRDILEIAKRQLEIEKTIPKNSSYLFLDTDLIVCIYIMTSICCVILTFLGKTMACENTQMIEKNYLIFMKKN